jgi:hypothetical protein
VGLNFREAVMAAREADYFEFCRFEQGQRIMASLPEMSDRDVP